MTNRTTNILKIQEEFKNALYEANKYVLQEDESILKTLLEDFIEKVEDLIIEVDMDEEDENAILSWLAPFGETPKFPSIYKKRKVDTCTEYGEIEVSEEDGIESVLL